MIQGSEEWVQARIGKITGSRAGDVMARLKNGSKAAAYENYLYELVCETLSGQMADGFVSKPMQRGIDLEATARMAYEVETGRDVELCGLIDHPRIRRFAASPDGLVGAHGCVEIKCPNTSTHVGFLKTGVPSKQYWWQMQAQMACAGRAWCDFVTFDDRMPEPLQIGVVRVHRDREAIKSLQEAVLELRDAVDAECRRLRSLKPIRVRRVKAAA